MSDHDDSDAPTVSRPAPRIPWGYLFVGALCGVALTGVAAFFLLPTGSSDLRPGGSGSPAGGPGFAPPPVETAEAVETIAAEPVQLLGTVAPLRRAVVASEVDGVVAEVLVEEGDEVAVGDVLARLRTTTMELDLAAARANRDEAEARLVRFEAELRRLTRLLEQRAISRAEFDEGLADRDAQAQTVARYDAEAARLSELIDRARIGAPFSGRVTVVHVELGEWVERGGDVATMFDLDEVEITVPVPERYVSQARTAQREGWPVQVTFDALQGDFEGIVKAVIPEANPQSRTFPVIVVVDNEAGRIQGGMLARVWAQLGERAPTVLVPKDALVLRAGRVFVYRVRPGGASAATGRSNPPAGAADGPTGDDAGARAAAPAGGPAASGAGGDTATVEELSVEIGPAYGAWQVVRGDLSGGDVVVVRGNENLRPGAAVMPAGTVEFEAPPEVDPSRPMATERRRQDGR